MTTEEAERQLSNLVTGILGLVAFQQTKARPEFARAMQQTENAIKELASALANDTGGKG